jgi:hypothetical protein
MRRRLLDLCLLAYPRVTRRRDRDYLRDLALELAGRQGLARQAASLLLGGVRERAAGTGQRSRRMAAVSLAGLALACGALAVSTSGQGNHEVNRFACADTASGGRAGCAAQARSLVSWRERAGWRCGPRDGLPWAAGATWECTRNWREQ